MATLVGRFVDKNGTPRTHQRAPIEVTRDGAQFHFRLEGSGRGTITMNGASGGGSFTTHGSETFQFSATHARGRLAYRLHRGADVVAEGEIFDLPP